MNIINYQMNKEIPFFRKMIDLFKSEQPKETLKREPYLFVSHRSVFDQEHFDKRCQENDNLENVKIQAQQKIDSFRSTLSKNDLSDLGLSVCVFNNGCEPGNTMNECRYHVDHPIKA